jgi:hypothetical protein
MNLPRQDGPQQRETRLNGSQPWKQTRGQHGLTTAAQLSARPSSSAKNRMSVARHIGGPPTTSSMLSQFACWTAKIPPPSTLVADVLRL